MYRQSFLGGSVGLVTDIPVTARMNSITAMLFTTTLLPRLRSIKKINSTTLTTAVAENTEKGVTSNNISLFHSDKKEALE